MSKMKDVDQIFDALDCHLTSKKVNKFEIMDQVDDDRLAQLIPDFYVFPEKSVSYNILKQGKHAFILSIGNRAIMHCAR
jgi:hypothetical protein